MQASSLSDPSAKAAIPTLYSISDACAALGGMGRTWLYEQIKLKRLRAVKLGHSAIIPASKLELLIASQLESAA